MLEAAVVGLPDDKLGEVPVAAVRLRPKAKVTRRAARGVGRVRMAQYKAPTRVVVVDDLPAHRHPQGAARPPAAAVRPGGLMSDRVDEERALFVPDGDSCVPTGYARGPWSPHSLHGGPVAALVRPGARRRRRAPTRPAGPGHRRAPATRCRSRRWWCRTEVVRPGAKVSTVDAARDHRSTDELLVMARAQRIRTAEVEFADGVSRLGAGSARTRRPTPRPGPERTDSRSTPTPPSTGSSSGRFGVHRDRAPTGSASGCRWCSARSPPAGSGAAAIADFSNGISAVVPFDGSSLFINPDLTVHLWREPGRRVDRQRGGDPHLGHRHRHGGDRPLGSWRSGRSRRAVAPVGPHLSPTRARVVQPPVVVVPSSPRTSMIRLPSSSTCQPNCSRPSPFGG